MSESSFRVRIFQPIVPEYRVGLFNRVGKRFGGGAEIWAAARCFSDDVSLPLADMPYDYAHPLKRIGPAVWQKGLSLSGLRSGRDVIVICGDIHEISSLWMAFLATRKRIGVVWWGHHKTARASEWKIRIRLWFVRRLATVILSYTEEGKEWYRKRGFKEDILFYTGNTIDEKPILDACSYWNPGRLALFQEEHCLNGKKVLLFCSVLREKTRLEQAIECLSRLKDQTAVLVVIGDGPERKRFEECARKLKVDGRVVWVGNVREQRALAPWFLSAKLFLYPGAIGLSIIHAFLYGLPVVTHSEKSHHGPEFAAMAPGKTGMVYPENDVAAMADTVGELLADAPRLQRMSAEARRVAFGEYTMDKMADRYCEAILKCRRLVSRR